MAPCPGADGTPSGLDARLHGLAVDGSAFADTVKAIALAAHAASLYFGPGPVCPDSFTDRAHPRLESHYNDVMPGRDHAVVRDAEVEERSEASFPAKATATSVKSSAITPIMRCAPIGRSDREAPPRQSRVR